MIALERSREASRRSRFPIFIVSVAAVCLFFTLGSRSESGEETSPSKTGAGIDDFAVPTCVGFGSIGNVIGVGVGSLAEEKPGELEIVDVKTGAELSLVKFSHPYQIVVATAVSPNERFVAASAISFDGSGEWFVFD